MSGPIVSGPARRPSRVVILDHGSGNIHSLAKGLRAAGAELRIESPSATALDADLIVLPGVGAFSAAAERLAAIRTRMRDALGRDVAALGICLGMQLLFEESEEGPGRGLGVLAGRVTRLGAARVPHMGWNAVERAQGSPWPGTGSDDPALARAGLVEAYFAHGYACRPTDPSCVTAWTSVAGDRFPSVVRAGSVVGTQFHPEKSGAPGLEFLRAIVDDVRPRVCRAAGSAWSAPR